MSNIESIALEVAEQVADIQGVYVVDVDYSKDNKDWSLKIFIDKKDGIGIDECEQFSVAFSERFDKIDPITEKYCLIVSSPGLDRTLKKEREFMYYCGREVDVKLYAPIDGLKEFSGVLTKCEGKALTVLIDSEREITFKTEDAAFVKLSFKM